MPSAVLFPFRQAGVALAATLLLASHSHSAKAMGLGPTYSRPQEFVSCSPVWDSNSHRGTASAAKLIPAAVNADWMAAAGYASVASTEFGARIPNTISWADDPDATATRHCAARFWDSGSPVIWLIISDGNAFDRRRVEKDWPYIFTDLEFEPMIEARFAAIKQGFDHIRGRTPKR
jgi:hypothetical protein